MASDLFSTTAATQPGYFRIGYVILQIPPTDIATNKVVNDDQLATIRGISPMFIKSGQARWDVTVRWKAVRFEQSNGTYDYSQWVDLRNIVAMFKASPFIEAENAFLRQHFLNLQLTTKVQRMAFAMRQLRIDTNPDSTNVLDIVLTMSLFNYTPYTKDFGYQSDSGDSVNSTDSTKFQLFISNWISRNMDNHPGSQSSPPVLPWTSQDEGVITFMWRNYTWVPFTTASSTLPATAPASAAYTPTAPPTKVPKRVSSKTTKLSDDIQNIINAAAAKYGLDPKIVTAQCIYESNGNPSVVSRTGAVGLLQLLPTTAKLSTEALKDPQTNAEKGCQYLAQQLKTFGNYPHALGAYNAGPAYVYAYRDGKTQNHGKINPQRIKTADGLPPAGIPNGENAPLYVKTIMTNAGYASSLPPMPVKSTDGKPPAAQIDQSILSIPDKTYQQKVLDAIQSLPNQGDGWFLDYYTEQGVFFFQDLQLNLASADSQIDGDFDMFPNQISVVLVNNLPVIPLSAMQYPTYQHVGPTDTMISINFNSVGDDPGGDNPLNEPLHGGIIALAAMSSQLEEQFHNLRTTVRAVSSIHRMQAVFIQNRLLNMLGINGTMLRGLNTETVPESSDLVQVSLLASQYENVFEESSPFRINGIPSAYNAPLKNILTNGQLSKLAPEEQQAIAFVKQFADAWAAKDESFLLNHILSIASTKTSPAFDILTDMGGVADSGLRPDEKDFLLGALDLDNTTGGLGSSNTTSTLTTAISLVPQALLTTFAGVLPTNQAQSFPGLESRRLVLKAPGKSMTFADYFVFSQLPKTSDATTIARIKSEVNTRFKDLRPDTIDAMYQTLFDWELRTNPLVSREAQIITNNPAFSALFANAITVNGPALQKGNEGHECYKDLGITGYNQDPALYFVDYSQQMDTDKNNVITDLLTKSNQTANDVNQIASVQSSETLKNQAGSGVSFTGDAQGLPGQSNTLIRMTNLPVFSMNAAYPTYKLMLIEEDNTGPFFAFDNFYSYASVQDIEIMKYRDRPDQAIIQITNLAHLLQHRLFDDSAAGKMEKDADKFNNAPGGALTSTGEATTGGNPAGGIIASKTAGGAPYQTAPRKNMTEGRDEASKRVPLKYFALQTGAKIQVRIGYSNNPDALYPVFTGQITDIEGDDILIITAQSFQLELMNIPGTAVKHDSYLGFNFASGGAAFGGMQIMNSGTTSNILKTLIGAPIARHFGHWQIGGVKDKLLKGFSWTDLAGKTIQQIAPTNGTASTIGALLQSGYDRSGENILVNSTINLDATQAANSQTNNTRRTFLNENPNVLVGTAAYSIPKQTKMNLWDIIRDVSRRYPHFNTMVRAYGFPYGADATLVFGHPLDWYYGRPRLFGDSEREIASNNSHGQLFSQWWSSTGSVKWNDIFTRGIAEARNVEAKLTVATFIAPAAPEVLVSILNGQKAPQTATAGSGPVGFQNATQTMHNLLNGLPDPNAGALSSLGTLIANFGNISAGLFQAVDADFQVLYREWQVFLQLSDPAANSSRLRAIRQYHLIDQNHIVHNGLTVNDKIYNAVKIKDEKPLAFNQNIPEQHLRVLDVTDTINNVDTNVLQGAGNPLLNAYAQSFLRDEVGKMYEGEIILRGVPQIEPYDVLLLSDPSTGIVGPVEVDSVIHSFNLENGFITIVKPRALVIVNEACSLGLIASLGIAWATAKTNIMDMGHIFNPNSITTTLPARAVGAAVAVGGTLATGLGFAFTSNPVGLGILALTAGLGIMMYAEKQSKQNFFKLMPLSRFGRPWIGGLQGFAISDFAYSINKSFQWFQAEEIAPTIESWNELLNYRADILYPAEAAQ